MIARIAPGKLTGSIVAIPSKSQAHRLLIAAALADEPTLLRCDPVSEDILATARCLQALCADVERLSEGFLIKPLPPKPRPVLDCGESGSTWRFLLPVAAALGAEATFLLSGRLPERPMAALYETLEAQGLVIQGQGSARVSISGRLRGGDFSLPGDVSSQFVSGLMLAGPLMSQGCRIQLSGALGSKGYVAITRQAMARFGVQTEPLSVPAGQRYQSPGEVQVEGDWSNAAFWLCLAALGSDLRVSGLDSQSPQGDKAILDILRAFGADVSIQNDTISVRAPADGLQAADIDIDGCPDLAPPVALLATQAKGESRLSPTHRLRLKESDRAQSIMDTLNVLGADIRLENDRMLIRGGTRLTGGKAQGHQDHRIVMMAAIAASVSEQAVTISGAEAVDKSYPDFFEHLGRLGADLAIRQA